jgi:predicted MPP superfamily phosphohydrolase
MYHFIHLSDLHYRDNWEENQGLVLEEFFKDLKKQVAFAPSDQYYLIMSGDFVLAGDKKELFEKVQDLFDNQLNQLNIPTTNRFCVPGNHDVERNYVERKFVNHDSVVKRSMNEKEFNDYIQEAENMFSEKFHNYFSFTSKFSKPLAAENECFTGVGYKLNQDISIYCLNTAICSSGGYNEIDDKGFLSIDTRNLHKWLSSNDSKYKILVMHHPIDWLTEWAKMELNTILKKYFNLCLFGHVHSQDYHYSIIKESAIVECSAPPLFTHKRDELGYAIFTFSGQGLIDLTYRQWSKKSSNFLTGVNFSNTDNGKVVFNRIEAAKTPIEMDETLEILDRELSDALESFVGQPIIWVDPIISKSNDIADFNHTDNRVPIEALLITTDSLLIKSPPQFGLTCLSKYLIKTAWQLNKHIWVYLDSNTVGPHNLDSKLRKELDKRRCRLIDVKCIILDSWKNSEKEKFTLLKNLSTIAKDIQIIVMQTIDDINFLNEENEEEIDRDFEVLHLLALPRGHVRKVVAQYNSMKHIGEEDGVINKVISDLDVLNIHRTPMNCLTILKVSEKFYDENPVNRTKMLERILIMLFELPEIPTYKSRPDVIDCQYVLGYFCESLIKIKKYTFSREEFSKKISSFSKEKLITIEDDLVFDIL